MFKCSNVVYEALDRCGNDIEALNQRVTSIETGEVLSELVAQKVAGIQLDVKLVESAERRLTDEVIASVKKEYDAKFEELALSVNSTLVTVKALLNELQGKMREMETVSEHDQAVIDRLLARTPITAPHNNK